MAPVKKQRWYTVWKIAPSSPLPDRSGEVAENGTMGERNRMVAAFEKGAGMRQNFDFVSMGDYQRDMDQQTALAAEVVEVLGRENKKLRELVSALVKAAGGKITVPWGDLPIGSATGQIPKGMRIVDRADNMTREFRV